MKDVIALAAIFLLVGLLASPHETGGIFHAFWQGLTGQ